MQETVFEAASLMREALSDPYPPASEESEYPALRTGQGRVNTIGEVNEETLAGGFGFVHGQALSPAIPPHEQAGAAHLTQLVLYGGRLGPADLFMENVDLLRAVFTAGLRQ